MTAHTISPGTTGTFTLGSGDTLAVLSGGTALYTIVGSRAAETIAPGGVDRGGTVSGAIAMQLVNGSASATTVLSGGEQLVGSAHVGGSASNATVLQGGMQLVEDTGSASGTTLSGGDQFEYSGAAVTSTTVDSGGMLVFGGGILSGTTVGSGGTLELMLERSGVSGQFAGANAVHAGGTIAAGGAVAGVLSSGFVITDSTPITGISGGVASGVTVAVLSQGATSGLYLGSGAFEAISGGGTAGATVVAGGGFEVVSSGGQAIGATIDAGGTVTVAQGGTIAGTVSFVGTGGLLTLSEGSASAAVISGFAAGDTIDLAGLSATSASYANGTLSLLSGGATVASLDLAGSYATGDFSLSPDGLGGTDITLSSTLSSDTAPGDFNGDGMSDVLWQNDNAQDGGTGQVSVWLMNGVTPTATAVVGSPPPSWHALATGDFFGPGDAAILWQNDNGEAAIWEMNGTTPTAESVFATPAPDWHAVATGDFGGAGDADVVWQYEDTENAADPTNGQVAVWEINGITPVAEAVIASPPPDWHVIGTGGSDLLWQYEDTANAGDPQNGDTAIWEMNGLTPVAAQLVAQPGPDWQAIGTGDFVGNGNQDILWQYEDGQNASDPLNGETAIWLMNGATPSAETVIANPGAAWHAIGIGDYNGDGKSDILWQNTNGEAAIWEMNGTTPVAESIFATPPSTWHVIPA